MKRIFVDRGYRGLDRFTVRRSGDKAPNLRYDSAQASKSTVWTTASAPFRRTTP